MLSSALGKYPRQFLSTPSARRATHFATSHVDRLEISIHALREEGDLLSLPLKLRETVFLSTPSARRATKAANDHPVNVQFLSTPSARRATASVRGFEPSLYNFYPRPPRGGRLLQL